MAYKASEFIEAIQGTGAFVNPVTGAPTTSGGIVSTIARRLRCSRQTVYNAIGNYATVEQALQDERDSMKDLVEGEMLKKIMGGDTTMIIFYAKTQMKDRGYVERQERTGKDGEPLQMTHSWRTIVDEAKGENGDDSDNA